MGRAMKLITRDFIKANKLNTPALFKSSFSGSMFKPHEKNGYITPFIVELTRIPLPVPDGTIAKILEADNRIKEEKEAVALEDGKLSLAEYVIKDIDKGMMAKHHETSLRPVLHTKIDIAIELLHNFYPNWQQRASGLKGRLFKLAGVFFENLGKKNGSNPEKPVYQP